MVCLTGSTDRAASDASFARSKKYAQEALALASKFPNDPDYGKVVYHATVTLAVHALREGDRKEAVRHMRAAVNVPASRGLEAYSFGLDGRLVNDLLKAGERETVAEFLEGSARLRPAEREQLLERRSRHPRREDAVVVSAHGVALRRVGVQFRLSACRNNRASSAGVRSPGKY